MEEWREERRLRIIREVEPGTDEASGACTVGNFIHISLDDLIFSYIFLFIRSAP